MCLFDAVSQITSESLPLFSGGFSANARRAVVAKPDNGVSVAPYLGAYFLLNRLYKPLRALG